MRRGNSNRTIGRERRQRRCSFVKQLQKGPGAVGMSLGMQVGVRARDRQGRSGCDAGCVYLPSGSAQWDELQLRQGKIFQVPEMNRAV